MTREVAARLETAGMERAACETKAGLFDRASSALSSRGATPVCALFVPGRIEVLGKHTDYAGGRSLLCALERGFCLVAAPRTDARIRAIDASSDEEAQFEIDPERVVPDGGWVGYVSAVARRLARNFPGARAGADICFISDLPPASGLSSSSALVTAVFLALAAVNRLDSHDAYRRELKTSEDLAGYVATIENGQPFGSLGGDQGVGTFGGSEDHTAMLCCQPKHLSQYSFGPIRRERAIVVPEELSFVIAVSGVAAEKTGAARDRYNRLTASAAAILRLWCAATGRSDPTLAAAASSATDAPDRIRMVLSRSADTDFTSGQLLARFDQFLLESAEIVPAAGDAFARGDIDAFGALVDRSQRAAEQLLGNQVPETVMLARSAREEGALAASAFGGGFGGSVWALARSGDVEAFRSRWEARYGSVFPERIPRRQFFPTRPAPPAVWL